MIPQLNEKEQQILTRLVRDPNLSVTDLARELDVSSVTMRGYLNGLAEKGYLYRVRGGAIPTIHPEIVEREQTHQQEKRAIAQYAASLVQDGDTIMIEAGTTTAMVARYLLGKRDVSIVTNNALAMAHARGNPGLRVNLVGGEYRPANESIVGPLALSILDQFHVKIAFVGTDGFSIRSGLSTHLVEGAEIVRRMAAQADRVVVLADSSKWNHTGFVHVLPLTSIDTIVTDVGIADDAAAEIAEAGVDTVQVEPN
ncbi:MAG TPA: DeoR/GlpR family DNA-binding transcription regulator [Alkalispirochaeta sp.]|nr:DeoR/GlpR family DNA-binding transcription regulator [Alkalispirochaeta sp.]